MSHKNRKRIYAKRPAHALLFAALGDETRLALVATLCSGRPCSISQLTEGSKLTRQAIAKHLRVLQKVGIVHSVREGRETRFQFDPEPLEEMNQYLDFVSKQWDRALARRKAIED